MKKIVLSLIGCWFAAAVMSAQQAPAPAPQGKGVIGKRQRNQQKRIGEGVENGSLTAHEAARLERKETRINREIHRDRADGNFSAREKAKVTRQQNRVSRQIYRQKHDGQTQK